MCRCIEHGTQDPVKTALEAVERARYLGRDVLIIDTAGRLHIDQELMDELQSASRKMCIRRKSCWWSTP